MTNRVRPKKKSVFKNLDQKFLENEVQVKNGSIFLKILIRDFYVGNLLEL